jgi:hypothetical protein
MLHKEKILPSEKRQYCKKDYYENDVLIYKKGNIYLMKEIVALIYPSGVFHNYVMTYPLKPENFDLIFNEEEYIEHFEGLNKRRQRLISDFMKPEWN